MWPGEMSLYNPPEDRQQSSGATTDGPDAETPLQAADALDIVPVCELTQSMLVLTQNWENPRCPSVGNSIVPHELSAHWGHHAPH